MEHGQPYDPPTHPSDEAPVLKNRKRGLLPWRSAEGRIWEEVEERWWKTRGIRKYDNWDTKWACFKSKPYHSYCHLKFKMISFPIHSSISVFPRSLLYCSLLPPGLPKPWPPYCNRPWYWVQVFEGPFLALPFFLLEVKCWGAVWGISKLSRICSLGGGKGPHFEVGHP